MIFTLHFLDVMYHIDSFVDVEPSLLTWNKSHFIMVYDLFYVLLNSVCQCFVEDFCLYVHQRYWPVIFFFGMLASYNELGSIPFSSVFWNSLRRMGIKSSLNVVEFTCETIWS